MAFLRKNLPYEIHINRNKLYESLDYFTDQQESLEQRLAKGVRCKQSDLYLYDITSTYFEGQGAENICRYGYSRLSLNS